MRLPPKPFRHVEKHLGTTADERGSQTRGEGLGFRVETVAVIGAG